MNVSAYSSFAGFFSPVRSAADNDGCSLIKNQDVILM